MSETYTDFLGNEINVGDFVVYATVDGRSPVQKFARVEKIEGKPGRRNVGTYREPVYEPITVYKVGVREIKNGRGFTRWDSYAYAKGKDGEYLKDDNGRLIQIDKEVRVTYPNVLNIVKVSSAEESE